MLELVVALVLLAVLAGLALPSFARFLAEQELLAEAHRLSEAVTLARSEALKRNAHVVVCAASPLHACGTLGHWHEGWITFVDENDDAKIDPGELLIVQEAAAGPGMTAIGNRPVAKYFRFDWLGQARLVSGALQMGTVSVCRPGLRGYDVVLANSGRTRIERARAACP
jgi:type IV fimbrial biogenesis protein FimT